MYLLRLINNLYGKGLLNTAIDVGFLSRGYINCVLIWGY